MRFVLWETINIYSEQWGLRAKGRGGEPRGDIWALISCPPSLGRSLGGTPCLSFPLRDKNKGCSAGIGTRQCHVPYAARSHFNINKAN